MSMIAQFVQVTPKQLAQLLAKPSSAAEFIETSVGFFPEPMRQEELQQLAKDKLQQAAATSGETAQMLASLAALDPAMRQMLEQCLGTQGVSVDDLKGARGGEAILKLTEQGLAPLLYPRTPSRATRPADQTTALSLEKAWHGVHYLLCGEAEPGSTVLSRAVLGGTELGDDLGYGPARYIPVDQAAEIAHEMSRADLEAAMKARFDPALMSQMGIYPSPWDREAVEGLLWEFRRLRDFYVGAAARGFAVVTSIV